MTTRITKIDDRSNEKTTLRVEGSLRLEDAEVLESTYADAKSKERRKNHA